MSGLPIYLVQILVLEKKINLSLISISGVLMTRSEPEPRTVNTIHTLTYGNYTDNFHLYRLFLVI